MKKNPHFSFVLGLILECNAGFTQVAINTNGSDPDTSAMLD